MKRKILLAIVLVLSSCKKEEPKQQMQPFYKKAITPDDVKSITPEEAKTFHKDTEYQYEYRTGTSGNYEYNYDANGYDEEGNEVTAKINVEGKYGAGIIVKADGEEVDVQVEWSGHGKLKAVDNDGNQYELEVD